MSAGWSHKLQAVLLVLVAMVKLALFVGVGVFVVRYLMYDLTGTNIYVLSALLWIRSDLTSQLGRDWCEVVTGVRLLILEAAMTADTSKSDAPYSTGNFEKKLISMLAHDVDCLNRPAAMELDETDAATLKYSVESRYSPLATCRRSEMILYKDGTGFKAGKVQLHLAMDSHSI